MELSALKRDPRAVHAALVESSDGQVLIAKQQVKLYQPVRFSERKLTVISNEIKIVGTFLIVVGEFYGYSSACAMMPVTPTSMSIVQLEGEDYHEYVFDKGATICPNLNLVKDDTVVYSLYDEFVAKGHIPVGPSYEDLGKLFVTSEYHGGMTLSSTNVPMEMIIASISRDPSDRTKYYRHRIKALKDQFTDPPAFIAFRNIMYGATNTTAKMMGSYLDDGIASALVNPSERVEGVETLLRR